MPSLLSFLGGVTFASAAAVIPFAGQEHLRQIVSSPTQGVHVAVMSIGAASALALVALLCLQFRTATGQEAAVGVTSRELNSASVALQKQLSKFLSLLKEGLANSEQHGHSLDGFEKQLQVALSDVELRTLVRDLIASNQLYRSQSKDLEQRLIEAREQVTELQERTRHAETLASVDPLTGIANRRKFDNELGTLVSLSHEEKTPLCLVMADIDHFKAVNDKFGHRAGDAILRQFAELLAATVRASDVVARYGGEEFAMILPRAPLGNGYEVAERIRAAVEANIWLGFQGSEHLKLTASFGVADVRDDENAISLINRADAKLYEAKLSGRNRTIVWGSSE